MRKRSLFVRFFLSTCLLILLVVVALSSFFYTSYESDLLAVLRHDDHEVLLQLNTYLSENLEYSRILASSLLIDPDVRALIDGISDPYALAKRLETIKIKTLAYPYVHSIVVYDSVSGRYYFTLTRRSYTQHDFIDTALLEGLARQDDRGGLLRSLDVENNFVRIQENLLTTVVFLNPARRDSFIAVNLNSQEVERRMAQMSRGSTTDANQVFMVDSKGTIIAHTDRSQFGKSELGDPIYDTIRNGAAREGTFLTQEKGVRVVVSFIQRDEGCLIRITPYSQVFASLIDMRLKIVGVALLSLIFFLGTAFVLTRRIFRPLVSLTDKIDRIVEAQFVSGRVGDEVAQLDNAFTVTLEHLDSLRRYQEASRERFRTQLLEDLAWGRLAPEAQEVRTELGSEFQEGHGPWRLLGVRCSDESGREKARVLFTGLGLTRVFPGVDGNLVAVGRSEGISRNGAERSGMECTLGAAFGGLSQLPEAYEALRTAEKEWFFRPTPGLLLETESPASRPYPIALEEKTCEALRRHHVDEARAFTDSFLEQGTGGYEAAMVGITRFSTALFDTLGSLVQVGVLPGVPSFSAFVKGLQKATHRHQLLPLFRTCYDEVEAALNSRKGARLLTVADQIRAVVDRNFADPNLSLKTLAESVHLTPAYAGQIFRQVYGKSISPFLLELRLTRAHELIAEGGRSVAEVAHLVGMENYRYFSTRYKARYGVSPGARVSQQPHA